MDAEAAAPDFFDDLGDCCAFKSGMTHVQGTRYGSDPHIHVVRAVVAVPAEISRLLLGASGWRRGGLSIFLINDLVLGFLSRKDGALLDAGLH
jgi:hypothetical protein